MIDSFERGKAWYMYSRLEREFIDTTTYIGFEQVHKDVWSEKFAELLVRIGDLMDSSYRLMINSKSLDNEMKINELRNKIQQKRNNPKTKNWNPDINDFRITFNTIFQLSSVEVEADYGLTYYGTLQPFKKFDKNPPLWWESYNKIKHEIFEQIEKRATLENVISALAGIFILNILHKESQRYLIRYTDVFFAEYLDKRHLEKELGKSFIGKPKGYDGWQFIAKTPLFTHKLRTDYNVN